jgi:hypothetical protein
MSLPPGSRRQQARSARVCGAGPTSRLLLGTQHALVGRLAAGHGDDQRNSEGVKFATTSPLCLCLHSSLTPTLPRGLGARSPCASLRRFVCSSSLSSFQLCLESLFRLLGRAVCGARHSIARLPIRRRRNTRAVETWGGHIARQPTNAQRSCQFAGHAPHGLNPSAAAAPVLRRATPVASSVSAAWRRVGTQAAAQAAGRTALRSAPPCLAALLGGIVIAAAAQMHDDMMRCLGDGLESDNLPPPWLQSACKRHL